MTGERIAKRSAGQNIPVNPGGMCVQRCGRPAFLFNDMYCEACYDKLRRGGGENLVPTLVWVTRNEQAKTGGCYAVRWKTGKPDILPMKVMHPVDPKRQCAHEDPDTHERCDNVKRRNGLCGKHNPASIARKDRENTVRRSRYAKNELSKRDRNRLRTRIPAKHIKPGLAA